MNYLIMGNSGSGKSTFARELQQVTEANLLPLDFLWHQTDYSEEAQSWFQAEQEKFIRANENWIMDGNYLGISDLRFQHADILILLKVPRLLSLFRVISRSIKRKINPASRPDMPKTFQEKFDREYLDFLIYIWQFPHKQVVELEKILREQSNELQVIILKSKKDKKVFLQKLAEQKRSKES
ncbi:topology modulation protein [Candidatus Enterococcus courvalinii]|uniref:Topology modulation protein n=1 Tax=Candidatus Enterococcus courvalinii TaxID=2815329 RepID=A0ABS3I073_9ENTE|nr:topology modulation protein [Enterococcus sp. MSG2901]MBO0481710.1 topology modulation protein [Enterococcus sp. MSG2901]